MAEVKDPNSLASMGWRQGSVLHIAEHAFLFNYFFGIQAEFFIVAPYNCAVVNESFTDKEPQLEIFTMELAENPNPDFLMARDPRNLVLRLNMDGELQHFNVNIHNRYFINHAYLKMAPPSGRFHIEPREVNIFSAWIAKRYRRNAFPDCFDQRSTQVRSWLKSFLKKAYRRADDNLESLLGVYLILDPSNEELEDPDDPYELEVVILLTEEGMQNKTEDHVKLKEGLNIRYGACQGIELNSCEIKSATQILVSELQGMIRLDDYDFYSLYPENDSPLVEPI